MAAGTEGQMWGGPLFPACLPPQTFCSFCSPQTCLLTIPQTSSVHPLLPHPGLCSHCSFYLEDPLPLCQIGKSLQVFQLRCCLLH